MDLSEQTVSVATIVATASPLVGAAVTGAVWTVKRIVGKMDKAIEDLSDDVEDMANRCRKAEDKLRKEREAACREVTAMLADIRKECKECQRERQKEREDCVDTYGKFGARLTKVEAEHALQHRGESCLPR